MPLIGHVDEISRRTVTGWVADDQDFERTLEVAIFVNDNKAGQIAASVHREAVKNSLPAGATGKYGFEFTFKPPLSVFDELKIEVKVADTDQVLPRGSKVLKRPSWSRNQLAHIMVSSTGRSGSTLLMQKLAKFPEIVMGMQYPYEIKLVNYYSAALRVLAADTDRINSTHPDTMMSEKMRHVIGSNPFTRTGFHGVVGEGRRAIETFFEETVPDALCQTFREMVFTYYNLQKVQQNKLGARYFAEKSGLEDVARKGSRTLFDGVREIVLVRDPRDFLCSAKAFWNTESADAMRLVAHATAQLEQIYEGGQDDVLFVRYEDLVQKPAATMDTVSEFIGVGKPSAQVLGEDEKLFNLHATSRSPEASIGRWRNELSDGEIRFCDSHFRGFMDRHGYVALGAPALIQSA